MVNVRVPKLLGVRGLPLVCVPSPSDAGRGGANLTCAHRKDFGLNFFCDLGGGEVMITTYLMENSNKSHYLIYFEVILF